ncbi:MAG: hypothetical protein JWQ81_509 [Amycolatopsis sp.]|nr:hypothetical protein [Amycolatopsis sp.]
MDLRRPVEALHRLGHGHGLRHHDRSRFAEWPVVHHRPAQGRAVADRSRGPGTVRHRVGPFSPNRMAHTTVIRRGSARSHNHCPQPQLEMGEHECGFDDVTYLARVAPQALQRAAGRVVDRGVGDVDVANEVLRCAADVDAERLQPGGCRSAPVTGCRRVSVAATRSRSRWSPVSLPRWRARDRTGGRVPSLIHPQRMVLRSTSLVSLTGSPSPRRRRTRAGGPARRTGGSALWDHRRGAADEVERGGLSSAGLIAGGYVITEDVRDRDVRSCPVPLT